MDYKKKYEQALENLKRIKAANKDNKELVDFIEYQYPELKESEDERIRKSLIKSYTNQHPANFPTVDGFTREQILTWLEKQGAKESKKTSIWHHWNHGIAGNGEGKLIYLIKDGNGYSLSPVLGYECDYVLLSDLDKLMLSEKQGDKETLCDKCRKEHPSHSCQDITELGRCAVEHEQKPADNIIEAEKPLLEKFKQAVYDCAWGKVTCKKEGETKEEYAERWAEQLLILVRDWADDYIDSREDAIRRRSFDKGKQSIQNPAWSEEDEKFIHGIIRGLSAKRDKYKQITFSSDNLNITDTINWLKSLKERLKGE